jgi:hypothetical protein
LPAPKHWGLSNVPHTVVAAYKPKPGQDAELMELTFEHHDILLDEGLVTERVPFVMRAKDGTIVEVFEWLDGAVERAHSNPAVLKLWDRYAAVCDYVPLSQLAESNDLFAGFEAVEINQHQRGHR